MFHDEKPLTAVSILQSVKSLQPMCADSLIASLIGYRRYEANATGLDPEAVHRTRFGSAEESTSPQDDRPGRR